MWENSDGIPSPCIRICVLDGPTGWCRGCYRTIDEISHWERLTPVQKHALLARCAERRAQIPELPLTNE
jgi:predicted Fe-S protein YdhL (DUF1289 family)